MNQRTEKIFREFDKYGRKVFGRIYNQFIRSERGCKGDF